MDDPAFTNPSLNTTTQSIILYSSLHDLPSLKPLLRTPGSASVQDAETGTTPLHAAIASCSEPDTDIQTALAVVQELFFSGAIWNDLDANNETPGCIAWRLGERGRVLYEAVVNAGVRAEMLLGLLGGYEELGSEGDEEDSDELQGFEDKEAEQVGENGGTNGVDGHEHELAAGPAEETELQKEKKDVNSADYLASELTFQDDKLLDSDANGVMMAWETDIMRKTVDLLIPDLKAGARILNIGFGMGIVDRMFRETKPESHHIIEAHPAVLKKVSEPDSDFGKTWEESAPEGGKYKIHAGKWQDICPKLVEEGEVFDAIYFDTFGEDYSQLKLFFTEYVTALLDPSGRFGFFNGLGADRRVCYDVYCRVAEMDLCDAEMDVDWTDVDIPEEGMEKEGEGEWKGVRRRYWTLDKYRLPICTFLG